MDIKEIKNLKIVPKNYECATVFETGCISDDAIEIKLYRASKKELEGYIQGGTVEMFGLASQGLVYFTSEILNKKDNILTIKTPDEYRQIQRRKYTRVKFLGTLKISDFENIKPLDLSAGGLKFSASCALQTDNEYPAKLELINNLVVECTIEPIRATSKDGEFEISAKFKKIRSIDRIALLQYSLRMKSESENKG